MAWYDRFKRKVKQKAEGDASVPKELSSAQEYEKFRLKEDEYWCLVKDANGDSSIERRYVRAKRFEYDDGVVTLKSVDPKEKFEEIFPQLEPDFLNLKQSDITPQLQSAEDKLRDIQRGKIKNINIWNVKYEIFKLKAAERKLKYGKCSFQCTNIHREPLFTFIRKGSHLHPLAEDLDTNTVYVPSDYKKKKSAMSVRNKESKYSKFSGALISVGSAILLICGVIVFAGDVFWTYSLYKYSDSESALARIEQRFDNAAASCIDSIAVQNTELVKTSAEIKGISETLRDKLIPTTVIEGQRPVDFTR